MKELKNVHKTFVVKIETNTPLGR